MKKKKKLRMYTDFPTKLLIQHDVFTHYHRMPAQHGHDYYEIYFQVDGEKRLFIKDDIYLISKGDLVFVEPNELHSQASTENLHRERYLVYFTKDMFTEDPNLITDYSSLFSTDNPILPLDIHQQRFVEQLLHEMATEFKEKKPGYITYIKGLLTQLLVYCVRLHQKRMSTYKKKKKTLHPVISKAIEYVNENYAESIQLNDIAAHFSISPSYFSKLFRETIGHTLVEYITAVRIKEAQKLLRETEMKISLIAETVGFPSLKHFYKMFKKISEVTPRSYRQLYRSGK